jgi:hypothetical protein
MARRMVGVVVGLLVMLIWTAPSGAQTVALDDLTDPIEDTVEDTVDSVGGAVDETVESVEDTGEAVTDAAGGSVGGASDAVGDAAGDGSALSGAVSGAAGGGDADTGSGTASPGKTARAEQRGDRNARGQEALSGSREGSARGAQMARVAAEAGAGFPYGAAAYIPLLVQLTNDANNDDSYSDAEAALHPDVDVSFQIRLENAGSGELAVLAMRDTSPTPMVTDDDGTCSSRLVGIRIAPGESMTCRFTAGGFAPAEGQRVVTVIEFDAAVTAHPMITGTVADTTLVATGTENVLGRVIRQALASTGGRIVLLSGVAIGLFATGSALNGLANRQRRTAHNSAASRAGRIRSPGVPTGRFESPLADSPSGRGHIRRRSRYASRRHHSMGVAAREAAGDRARSRSRRRRRTAMGSGECRPGVSPRRRE